MMRVSSYLMFTHALQSRVTSPVTLSNLARDLEISPKTAKEWLRLIEETYLVFAITPYTKKVARSIIKPPKVYFYDNADVEGDYGARLENLVAAHLLKRLQFIEDYHGHRCVLHYIRDKEGREVDFVTVIDHEVHELIEVKATEDSISRPLAYYTKVLKPKRSIQLVGDLKRSFSRDGIDVMHPCEYFQNPPWDLIDQ